MEKVVAGEAELREWAGEFAMHIRPQTGAATVVALSGVLGAGKTTFTQAVAKALGVKETVTSPTFVIEKVYPLEGREFQRLIHIDAYRLKSADDLTHIHWSEITQDPANLVLLEWPERVEGAVPLGAIQIRFEIYGDGRIIRVIP